MILESKLLKNYTINVQKIFICSLREPVRNKVISSCLRTSENKKESSFVLLVLKDFNVVIINLKEELEAEDFCLNERIKDDKNCVEMNIETKERVLYIFFGKKIVVTSTCCYKATRYLNNFNFR